MISELRASHTVVPVVGGFGPSVDGVARAAKKKDMQRACRVIGDPLLAAQSRVAGGWEGLKFEFTETG